MKNTWNERLKAAMIEREVSASKLAKVVGVSSASISDWLSGKIKNMDAANSIKVCNYLSISPAWLFFNKLPNDENGQKITEPSALYKTKGRLGQVPVISWVRAGEMCDPGYVTSFDNADEWRYCPEQHSEQTYILVVDGDSMSPEYLEGWDIFVDPTIQARHNDDVIVRDSQGHATFKRLQITNDGTYLLALNPDHPKRKIIVPEDSTICGVVIYSGKKRR